MTDLQKQAMKEAMQIIHETCWYASEQMDCEKDCPFSKVCSALHHSAEVLYSYPCEWNWTLSLD